MLKIAIIKAMHSSIERFDKYFGLAIKQLPPWLHPVMVAASLIGEPIVLIVVAVGIAFLGYVKRQPRVVLAEALALLAFTGNSVLKYLLHRTRPDTLFVQHMKIKSFSFPSGHAFGSVVVYGLLAYLAFTRLPQPWNLIIAAILVFLIILIGISRVYLEAHFPSDVLAGWLLGGLCLFLIIYFVKP